MPSYRRLSVHTCKNYWVRLETGFRTLCYGNLSGGHSGIGDYYVDPITGEHTQPIRLRPNFLEIQYDKEAIELEGPQSEKWPGANWVEEDAQHPHDGGSNRGTPTSQSNRSRKKNRKRSKENDS